MIALNQIRTGTRLAFGFTVLLLMAGAITAIGAYGMAIIQRNLDSVASTDFARLTLVNRMRDAVRFQAIALRDIVMQEDLAFKKRELKLMKDARKEYQSASESLATMVVDERSVGLLAEIRTIEEKVKAAYGVSIDLSLDDKHLEAGEAVRETVRPEQMRLVTALDDLLSHLEQLARDSAADAQQTYDQAIRVMFVIGGLTIALGVAIAWLITRSISGPLERAVGVARRIAVGDLTARLEVDGNDEVSELLRALMEMNSSLARIIGSVQQSADTVAEFAGHLSSDMDAVAGRAKQQSDRLTGISAATEQMSASISEIARNAEGVLAASEHSKTVVHENLREAELAFSASQRIVEAVDQSGRAIGALSEAIQKISEITQVISGIADQTNLLALNAAIESARAGEQGRGFAVVADEVRVLSQRTTASTADIGNMVSALKTRSAESVATMERVRKEVLDGTRFADATNVSLKKIVECAGQVAELAHHIVDSTKEQTGATDESARNMETISHLAEHNTDSIVSVEKTAAKLNSTATALRELVGQFRLA